MEKIVFWGSISRPFDYFEKLYWLQFWQIFVQKSYVFLIEFNLSKILITFDHNK